MSRRAGGERSSRSRARSVSCVDAARSCIGMCCRRGQSHRLAQPRDRRLRCIPWWSPCTLPGKLSTGISRPKLIWPHTLYEVRRRIRRRDFHVDLTFMGLSTLPRAGEERWASDLAGRYVRLALEAEGVACPGPEVDRSAVTAVLPVDGDRPPVSHLPHEVARLAAPPTVEARALAVPLDHILPCGLRQCG